MKRFCSATALTIIAVLTLTACGSGGDSSSDHNDADVAFAQEMIPHHEQAVEMSGMARTNASSPRVKELAEEIDTAQGPEIDVMEGWLEDWDEPGSGSADDMDHGGMTGMMSDADMEALGEAEGAAFDKMFLTMMVRHHTAAIKMARTEQQDGENADARALAEDIERAQTAELEKMKRLLGS